MESIQKYATSHPLLKQIVSSIVFTRRSSDFTNGRITMPNNFSAFGITLTGELHIKNKYTFEKMPMGGTRNTLSHPIEMKTKGDFFNITIYFAIPKGLSLFTTIPMNVMFEEDVFLLSNIFTTHETNQLIEKLLEAIDDSHRLRIIESFLVQKLVNTLPQPFVGITEKIHHSKGLTSVSLLAKESSLSERTIHRYFNKYVGINPITYINLIRFRSVINLAKTSSLNTLENALEVGYYDQSHFIKHFKELSKVTPTQFFNLAKNNGLSDIYNL